MNPTKINPSSLITDHLDIWTSAIKIKSTAGRGSGKKQEFYGIKKLRELILELAVRGLLVPQDPEDEPATDLLRIIAKEKATLIKEGKLKKKNLPLETRGCLYDLPDSWEWVGFGKIALHNAGKTLDRGRNSGDLRDYITTSNLYWGHFDLTDVRQMPIREEELEKCSATKGDLLICEGGEAGRAAVWTEGRDICFQNHIHRARLFGGIDAFFAYRFLEHLSMSGEIENYRKGVGISNMSGKALASIPFPLPPLAEQHRIVAKVDELMALCDQLEQQQEDSVRTHGALVETLLGALTAASERGAFAEAWQRIASHFDTLFTTESSIDQLKQTILQLAVMGKLVEQDPKDEPAAELLRKIASEKSQLIKARKIKKQKPLEPFSQDEIPVSLPHGWKAVRFSELAQEVSTGPFGMMISKNEYIDSGVPLINPSHMIGGKIVEDPAISVSPQKAESLSSYVLCEGDIVMARRGEMGRCAKVTSREHNWLCGTGSFVLRFHREVVRDFILLLFKSKSVVQYLGGESVGATMTNLNHGILNKMPINIPPSPEQHRIVAKVDELMALCDRLKARLQSAQTTQLHLADTLVEAAIH